MHRSGFTEHEMDELVKGINLLEYVKVKTIFSHLSSADEPENDEYSMLQINQFIKMFDQIQNTVNYKIKKHLLNSAGVERFTKYQFDYVRIGIGLHGISAIKTPLHQVGTLKSTIAQIKKVEKGSTIGYNRKGILKKDSVIATIPMGYADGLRRSLGNGVGKFWIKNQQVPIIGNVCMDMCMIDVGQLDIKVGDEVELFGKNQSIYEVSEWMETIPYEVLTGISRRVKRTYLVQ